MDVIPIQKEEWIEWKHSNVTRRVVQDILHKREILKEGWAEGHVEETQLIEMGRCQAYKDVIELIVDGYNSVEEENKEDVI